MALSERERAILEFERSWWKESRPKEAAIRDRLGLAPTTYYRQLAVLAESAEAREYDPLLVLRLRRERSLRRRERFEGRSAGGPRS